MRRKLLLCSAFALVASAMVGCSEEPTELNHYTTESAGPEPTLAGFNEIVADAPEAITLGDDSEFAFAWESDDTFAVYEENGEWIANLKIADAAATVKKFTVVGDTRLEDDLYYVAVYPAPKSGEEGSYDDYVNTMNEAITSAEQIQEGTTSDHLKGASFLKVGFKGNDPIKFDYNVAFATVNFRVEEGVAPSSLRFVDGEKSYTVALNNMAVAATADDVYTAYMAIATASTAKRAQSFYVPAEAETPVRTIDECADNYSAGGSYSMSTFVIETYNTLSVNMPATNFPATSFTWADGDKVSLYNAASGEWVADCTLSDVATATFAIEGDVELDNATRYTAVYPARTAEATFAEYKSAAISSLAEQSQTGDLSSKNLKSECYLVGEFKGGEVATLEHQTAVVKLTFDAVETPTSLTFTDAGLSYNVALEGLEGKSTYTAYMAVQPTVVEEREQSLIVYFGEATQKYSAVSSAVYTAGGVTEVKSSEMISASVAQISTADELVTYLAGVAGAEAKDAKLAADIDLAGVAISPAGYLTKELDGNGYKIKNLTISTDAPETALFKGLKAGGVLKNITIEGADVTGTQYVGVLVGKIMEGGLVTDCHVTGGKVVATNNIAGGLFGQSKGVIASCSFEGSVETQTDANAAGIVAVTMPAEGYECSITDCHVNATIVSKKTYAAGITAKAPATPIVGCSFEGSVSGTGANIAGIVGESAQGGRVVGCVNKGKVLGVTKIGGIAGSFPNGGDIVACYNLGEIGEDGTTTGSTAGIVGEAKETTNVTGCYNYSIFGKQPNNGNIGQITGYVKAAGAVVTVTDCYYVNLGTGNSVNGTKCADIAELNSKVDAMNTAINATAYATYNYTAGEGDATPTLIAK